MDRVSQLQQIQAEALELFTRKNKDYGDAFATFGLIGVLIRIEDKIKRALTIQQNQITLVDESIRDTLIDLHNYAAMALMLKDESIKDETKDESIKDETEPDYPEVD